MQKVFFVLSVLCLGACATNMVVDNGLTKLTEKPKNCELLYTITTDSKMYDLEDAYEYLETSIKSQNAFANSYYVVSQNKTENIGAIFGPKYTYKLKTEVYNCKK